jgi:predicted cupin superfamily sugar epimerase
MLTAAEVIAHLQLAPLPREGGYFRETYRSRLLLPQAALPRGFLASKSAGTAIYYLLTPHQCSALHRLPTDEVFHFYLGNPVTQLQLFPDGTGRTVVLGHDLRAGQLPQVVVPAHVWQGSWVEAGAHDFALLGTTMAPGFDFPDYEPGGRARLLAAYPSFAALIQRLLADPDAAPQP